MQYKTRKHQLGAISKEVKAGKETLRRALRDAAMVGACEERARAITIIETRCSPETARAIVNAICARSILDVLGYEE